MALPPPPPLPGRRPPCPGTRVKRSTDLTPTKVLNPLPPYSQKLYKLPLALLQKGSSHASPVWIKRFRRAEVWLMQLAPISLQEWNLIRKSCIGSSCLTSAKASNARLAETSSHPNPRRQNISSSRSTSTQKCGSVFGKQNVEPAREKEPEMQEMWYKKTVGEEASFLETAKDYFNQFKEIRIPAQKHWICLKSYINQKCGLVFGKQNVELALEKDPEMQKCYKKTVREEATFLETARDYFNQIPAQKHWICLKNYINQKCGSVFGKQKVEPVVKDEMPEVVAKPATGDDESK